MKGFPEHTADPGLFEASRDYTREHAKAFFFASFALPRAQRYASYAVYAFCRYADNLVDHDEAIADPVGSRRRISELREQLRHVYDGSALLDPRLAPFCQTVHTFDIPKEYFDDLLRGVEMDLWQTRYETFDDLRNYCYCVASVVGLIMTRILGATDERALPYAADLGTAMQLTNILRDVGEDARMGRVYLPQEDLARFRYSESELHRGIVNENFRGLMKFQIDRASEYYRRAERGIPFLASPSAKRTVRTMARSYRRILDKIQRNRYDVFRLRAYVPAGEKLIVAATSLFPGPGELAPVDIPLQEENNTADRINQPRHIHPVTPR